MKKIIPFLISACCISSSFAGTEIVNIDASSTLQASCSVSADNPDAGTFAPGLGSFELRTSIYVICTKGSSYIVKASTGNGTYAQRHLVSDTSSDKLLYNLYTVRNTGIPFGDGSGGTLSVFSGVGTGAQISHTLFTKMSKNQYVTPALYRDNITLTIEY